MDSSRPGKGRKALTVSVQRGTVSNMETRYSSENLLTRQEAADRLKVSLTTMSTILKSGDLFYFRFRREVRIPVEALDDYINGVRPPGKDNPLAAPDGATYPPTESMLKGDDDGR